jgi:hypothetical protein
MIKLIMQDWYPEDKKSKIRNQNNELQPQKMNLDRRIPVNINILLNRIRVEKKQEAKKKIFLFSAILSLTTFFGFFMFYMNS